MNTKQIVKILDNHTTPNTKSVEYPYYVDVARAILEEIGKEDRIFNANDMISFVFYVQGLNLGKNIIYLNESQVKDFQNQYCESEFLNE